MNFRDALLEKKSTEKQFGKYVVVFHDDLKKFTIKSDTSSYAHSLTTMTYDEAEKGEYKDTSPYHKIVPEIVKYLKTK